MKIDYAQRLRHLNGSRFNHVLTLSISREGEIQLQKGAHYGKEVYED